MVRRNKDLINTVRGTLKAFGVRTGDGKNTFFARRVRKALDDKAILALTKPLLIAYEDGLRTLAKLDDGRDRAGAEHQRHHGPRRRELS